MYLIYGLLLGSWVEPMVLKALICILWFLLLLYLRDPWRLYFPAIFLIMVVFHQHLTTLLPLGYVFEINDHYSLIQGLYFKIRLEGRYQGNLGDFVWFNEFVNREYVLLNQIVRMGSLPFIQHTYETIQKYPHIHAYFFENKTSYFSFVSFQIRVISKCLVLIKQRFNIPIHSKILNCIVTLWYQYLFGVNPSNLNFLLRQFVTPAHALLLLTVFIQNPLKQPAILISYGPMLVMHLGYIFCTIPKWLLRTAIIFYTCKRLDLISLNLAKLFSPILGGFLVVLHFSVLSGVALDAMEELLAHWFLLTQAIEARWVIYGMPPLICFVMIILVKSKKHAILWYALTGFITVYNPLFTVTFIDVGQGDSILVRAPFSAHVTLIDTGKPSGYPEVKRVLAHYGIRKLDQLIITHEDADHDGNRNRILKDYNVIKVIDKKGMAPELLTEFLEEKVYPSKNDNSILLSLQIKDHTLMFMGDASREQERDLVALYDFKTPIRILKLGHHGSKTSTDPRLLEVLKPDYAIISSNPRTYGHPHDEVIHRLKQHRIQILETSKAGSIHFVFTPFFDYIVSKRGVFGIIE